MGAGDNGTIVHSSDGEHWSAQTSNTSTALRSIYGTSDGRSSWAVDNSGTIVHSSDGEHWGAQTRSTPNTLNSIYGTSEGKSL